MAWDGALQSPDANHPGQAPGGSRAPAAGGRAPGPRRAVLCVPAPAGQTPLAAFLTCPRSPQGLFVLLFHCVLNREVRKHLKGVLSGKKPHPDDSATTRATLLTVGGTQGHLQAWGLGCTAHQGSVWGSGPSGGHGSVPSVPLTKGWAVPGAWHPARRDRVCCGQLAFPGLGDPTRSSG